MPFGIYHSVYLIPVMYFCPPLFHIFCQFVEMYNGFPIIVTIIPHISLVTPVMLLVIFYMDSSSEKTKLIALAHSELCLSEIVRR